MTYNLLVRVMRQLSKEERKIIVIFFLQTGSLVQTQRKFSAHFPTIRKKPPANTKNGLLNISWLTERSEIKTLETAAAR